MGMRRLPVNKRRSSRSFNRGERRTLSRNFQIARGGWRL